MEALLTPIYGVVPRGTDYQEVSTVTKSEQATDFTSRVSTMYAIILRGNGVGSVDDARLLNSLVTRTLGETHDEAQL